MYVTKNSVENLIQSSVSDKLKIEYLSKIVFELLEEREVVAVKLTELERQIKRLENFKQQINDIV